MALAAALAALASAVVVLAVLVRLDGRLRGAFALVAGSLLLSSVTSALSRGAWSDVPLALASSQLLACVLAATAAVLLLLPASGGPRAWVLAVDAFLVVGSVFVVAWVFGWHRVPPPPTDGTVLAALGRAGLGVEVLGGALAVPLWVSRRRGERLAPRLVAGALVLQLLTDSGLLGAALDPPAHVAVSVLLAAAAVTSVGRDRLPRRTVDADGALLAVVTLVAASVSLALVGSPQGLPRLPLVVSGAVMLVLLARLLVVARTNQRLVAELATREQHFRSMVDTTPDLLLRLGLGGEVGYVSSSAQRLLRVDPAALLGRRVGDLVVAADADRVRSALRLLQVDPTADQRLQVGVDLGAGPDGGRQRAVQLEAVASRVGDDVVVAVRDVTETAALREQLLHAARTDGLTGLANRATFDRALAARFAALGSHEQVAVLFCDLDGFKRINDGRGHAVGDALLREAARRVERAAGDGDLVCRYGGDEFTALLAPGADVAAAVDVATRLLLELSGPFTSPGGELVLSGSVGVAAAGPGGRPVDLVRDADVAMYHAKAAGRGLVRVFEPAMYAALARSVDLEQRLHAAVVDQALSVLYQPVVDLASGEMVGAEALLRWTDGDSTVIEASELVALAESSGDIHAIGRWVLEQAVAQAAAWADAGHPIGVAVNLSVHQVADPGLVEAVDEVLRRGGVPADRLTLEITETVLLDQAEDTLTSIERLRGLGVHLAVDDFGTGYSSLDYLRRLPVDQLKIDRSFLEGFGRLDDVTALVHAVIGIGHELGLSVTVEGVESALHVRLLRAAGAQHAQGYAFSRALDEGGVWRCLLAGPFDLDVPDDVRRLPRVGEQPRLTTRTPRPDVETGPGRC